MKSSSNLGPVMMDLRGPELTSDEAETLHHPLIGGLIFFTRNYQSPDQIAKLVRSVRAIRPDVLIAVDHEGGRVQRFREGFSRLPPARRYEELNAESPEQAARAAELAGWLMAIELRAVDIDFSFAPVLDVDSGISEIIGNRSFSLDANAVARLALAFRRGMNRAGMAAIGKHFPGHGGVALDSHLTLPEDTRSLAELESKDLLPFRQLVAEGLEGIMPAHVIYREVDSNPAGFSQCWLQEILRQSLGFQGAIFSDDLSMAGAAFAGDYRQRANLAMDAGCDMVLVCNQPEALGEVLEALGMRDSALTRNPRLAAMRGRSAIDRETLLKSEEWRSAHDEIRRYIQA